MTAAALPQSPEPYEVPEGGLASFLTATVGDWSDEALNSDNYYDIVKPTAEQLAAFGREEDDRIAHVATGETVIPMAVFEEDPALKEALFARMRDMGIEPERYVVGNELNSINPVTGQPEFFLKKLFKGIKKAVKGVVKVFKKIAPIVLSTVGFMVAGPLGASLGSGIGTLIQGGNLKDAFKSALIAGVTAGIGQGIGQGIEAFGQAGQAGATFGEKLAAGAQGFGESISSGLSGGYAQQFTEGLGSLTSQATSQTVADQALSKAAVDAPLTAQQAVQQAAPPQGGFFSPEGGAGTLSQSANTAADIAAQEAAKLKAQGIATGTANTNLTAGLTPPGSPSYATPGASAKTIAQSSLERAAQTAPGVTSVTPAPTSTPPAGEAASSLVDSAGQITVAGENAIKASLDTRGFFESMGDFIRNPTDLASLKQAFIPDRLTAADITKFIREHPQGSANFTATAGQNIFDALSKSGINPGIMRSYGPLAAAGLGIMGLAGGFEQPEMGELPDAFGGMTGAKLLGMYPEKYGLAQPGQFYQPPTYAANGGDIQFPRKNGAIYGPGTETSDDIPAMLSDGEFVMTAKAVRGAGNGSREAGMRRMYDMMRKFEGGAARGY